MEDNRIPPEEWKEVLTEAYQTDEASRKAMDRFNSRINLLKAEGTNVESDAEANRLYAELVHTVRTYLEGKVLAVKGSVVH